MGWGTAHRVDQESANAQASTRAPWRPIRSSGVLTLAGSRAVLTWRAVTTSDLSASRAPSLPGHLAANCPGAYRCGQRRILLQRSRTSSIVSFIAHPIGLHALTIHPDRSVCEDTRKAGRLCCWSAGRGWFLPCVHASAATDSLPDRGRPTGVLADGDMAALRKGLSDPMGALETPPRQPEMMHVARVPEGPWPCRGVA